MKAPLKCSNVRNIIRATFHGKCFSLHLLIFLALLGDRVTSCKDSIDLLSPYKIDMIIVQTVAYLHIQPIWSFWL